MKILINTYNTAFQNKAGGVNSRIKRTVEAVRKQGATVDYFDKYNVCVEDYDILHVFMLETENYSLINLAKKKGKKVVVSSVVTLAGEVKLRLYWLIRKLPIATTYKNLFKICEIADCLIAETQKEAKFLKKYYHVDEKKIKIVPNGVDVIEDAGDLIFDVIGKKCEYALEVGRFDKNKNQLAVIKAMKNTDIDVVFIGGESPSEPEYYQRCLSEANGAKNLHFFGWVEKESEVLKSAYENAKALISSSFCETFGLSIIEGAAQGAVPVISKTLPILDYDAFENCLTFDPQKPEDIKNKVEYAMKSKKNDETKNKIKEAFSWESVAKQHMDIYKSLL